MYNGIGITTTRGTGTNGYVQSNLSNLLFSRNKIQYNTEADIAKAEAVNREPNAELLDHEFKRAIEIKCVEFEDLMEGKGFNEAEIRAKVDEYRQLLYTDLEAGKKDVLSSGELDMRNTHSRAKVARDSRDRFRAAVGIDAAFVDGSSLEKIRKATEEAKTAAALNSNASAEAEKQDMEKSLMQKMMEKLNKAKAAKKTGKGKGKRAASSSSSSSSDSDSDPSDSSSSSSSSDSSPDRKRRKKSKKGSKKKSSSHGKRRKTPPPQQHVFKVPKQELESVRSERHPAVFSSSRRQSSRGGDNSPPPAEENHRRQRQQRVDDDTHRRRGGDRASPEPRSHRRDIRGSHAHDTHGVDRASPESRPQRRRDDEPERDGERRRGAREDRRAVSPARNYASRRGEEGRDGAMRRSRSPERASRRSRSPERVSRRGEEGRDGGSRR